MAALAGPFGCSSSSDGEASLGAGAPDGGSTNGDGKTMPTDGAYIRTRVNPFEDARGGVHDVHAQSMISGQNTATSLESLEYFITSIQICESVETTGTATGNAKNCLEIYKGPPADAYAYELGPNTDWTSLADTARTSDEGFVDLMDPTARKKLSADTRLSARDAHAYHYGLVYWALPIKVKATATSPSGDTSFYTHDGTTMRTVVGTDGFVAYPTVTSTPLTTGPAEKAVILHSNGGTWIRFQNPLVVTDEDIAEKRGWVLDLSFDPDGIVKGFSFGGPPASLRDSESSPNTMSVPLLDLTPIPHRESETVVKETYIGRVHEGHDDFDVRLEFYSIAEDPKHTVYGVDAKTLLNAQSSTAFSDFSKISFLETNDDGTLDLQVWDRTPVIRGFSRGAAVGDTTSVMLDCQGPTSPNRNGAFGVAFDACPGVLVPVTFTLTDVTRLAPSTPGSLDGFDDAGTSDASDASTELDAGAP
jgi:hypothetical protein